MVKSELTMADCLFKMSFNSPSALLLRAACSSSIEKLASDSKVKSSIDTFKVGTLVASPFNFHLAQELLSLSP